jgi:hypothetical protein
LLHVAHALLQRVVAPGALVLCLGYSESPIDGTPQLDLDRKLLGTWRCLPPGGRADVAPWSLAVWQPRERVYGVRVEKKDAPPRTLEAHASLVNGQPLLNVNVHELEQQPTCQASWVFARYAFLAPDVLRLRYAKEEVFKGVERTPAALRRALERVDEDPSTYEEGPLCVRTAPATPPAAAPTPQPTLSPSQQAAVDAPHVVARFVGTITSAALPRDPVKVIPIGVDPKFVLAIRIVKMIEGTLPNRGDSATFLIHSPSRFFADNLPKTPVREGGYPEGEFVFSLIGKRGSAGTAEFELHMAPPAGPGDAAVK